MMKGGWVHESTDKVFEQVKFGCLAQEKAEQELMIQCHRSRASRISMICWAVRMDNH